MKDKIYVVVGGEYSDWFIDCYFIDRVEADKYCVYKNNVQSNYAQLYVVEVPSYTGKLNFDSINLKRQWLVVYVREKSNWVYKACQEDELYLGKYRPTTSRMKSKNNRMFIVTTTAETKEKARKIAHDLISTYWIEEIL